MPFKIALLSILFFVATMNGFSQTFIPGNVYYDATGYVEYRAGNLPIILSAPHGGSLEPAIIPDRDCTGCVYVKDSWTQTITEGIYDAFVQETGCYPHVVINLLHRKKFDANRDIGDAADGNPTVEQSWQNYHDFINSAKVQVEEDYGRGLFLDMHGHAHTIQRIELGYLLSGSELGLTDAMLNTTTYIEESSIRTLESDNIQGHTHSELLRGQDSFGTLLDEKGFPAVPSLADPFPLSGEPYFSGGYNTVRHGSRDNVGNIDAIQIELNQDVRFDATNRAMLIDSMLVVANEYIDLHFNDQYLGNYCSLILPVEWLDFEAIKHQNKVLLSWQTTAEIQNDYFEIQRSSNARQFKTIGKLAGIGNATAINDYQFIDTNPQKGNNYYRLKQVDIDGVFSFSDIIHVPFESNQYVLLYPNPSASGKVMLDYFSVQNDQIQIAIYDITGRLVFEQKSPLLKGENVLPLDFSALEKGIYVLRIGTDKRHTFEKLVLE